uniref:tRNA/rRNA methyltransferase SpoU type domain-containing protein n=1 Tax=Heterosigma akashiwo TaxID=2829 RepID=A0A7S3Y6N0_HETAK
MEVRAAANMPRLLRAAREAGWRVVGLSLGEGALPLEEVAAAGAAAASGERQWGGPTVLVLGNEGHGLRTNVLRQCNVLCKIPGAEDASVDSLNVSVTGGIVMHHFMMTQQQQDKKEASELVR